AHRIAREDGMPAGFDSDSPVSLELVVEPERKLETRSPLGKITRQLVARSQNPTIGNRASDIERVDRTRARAPHGGARAGVPRDIDFEQRVEDIAQTISKVTTAAESTGGVVEERRVPPIDAGVPLPLEGPRGGRCHPKHAEESESSRAFC